MKKLNTILFAILVLGMSPSAFAQPVDDTAPPAASESAPVVADAAPVAAAPAEPVVEEKPVEAVPEAPAVAEDPAVQSALSKLIIQVIEVLAALLMVMALWLTKKGITFFEKKTKVDIPARYEEMLASWAGKSVDYANEKAHQYAKDKTETMTGPDKLEAALSFGFALAEEHGLIDLGKDKLVKHIESRLGVNREG